MTRYPRPESILPTRSSLFGFWLLYWARLVVVLPALVVRHVVVAAWNLVVALRTHNRSFTFLGGTLELTFVGSLPSLVASLLFGERMSFLRWQRAIVDPGPRFARKRVLEGITNCDAILLTHRHEEHIGNANEVGVACGAPIYASHATIEAMLHPERLPLSRRWVGQPQTSTMPLLCDVALPEHRLAIARMGLEVVESAGHCDGHISFYEPRERMLFAGDSFLHEVFTSPHYEVKSDEWIRTLERYAEMDISALVGCHGSIVTMRDDFGTSPFLVERDDPNLLIREKLAFTRFARAVVVLARKRGLSRRVIEAAFFPFAWRNWITDELARIMSGGDFSRSHFVGSFDTASLPARCEPGRDHLVDEVIVDHVVSRRHALPAA